SYFESVRSERALGRIRERQGVAKDDEGPSEATWRMTRRQTGCAEPAIASQLHAGRHWRGVGESERSLRRPRVRERECEVEWRRDEKKSVPNRDRWRAAIA